MTKHLPTLMLIVFSILLLSPSMAVAHCDTLDGPVIQDARLALDQKDVTPVLKWVRQQDENEIRSIFDKTLVVRMKGDAARALADTYFFETLVARASGRRRCAIYWTQARWNMLPPIEAAAG